MDTRSNWRSYWSDAVVVKDFAKTRDEVKTIKAEKDAGE